MSTKNKRTKLRFASVGVVNTLVDIGLYSLLFMLSGDIFISNLASTSAGLCTSYLLNRKFTFAANGNKRREITLFLIITLTGLWVLQPFIILLTTPIIEAVRLNTIDTVVILLPKLLATVVTLVWNYVLYKRFVFKSLIN